MKRRLLRRLVSSFPNFATLITSKKQGNGRCSCKLYSYASCAFGRRNAYVIQYQRGLSRCLSLLGGQCEGLETWDERQSTVPTLFYFMPLSNI